MNELTPPIRYYLPGEVRSLRDADRRAYRRGVVFLFAYVVAIVVPVRIGFDIIVTQKKFHAEFLQPYGPYVIATLAVTLLALGIRNVFKKRA